MAYNNWKKLLPEICVSFVIWLICNLLLESPKVLEVDLIDCQKQTDLHFS